MSTETITIRTETWPNPENVTFPSVELPGEVVEAVENCPKGVYQRGLLKGFDNWSGSSLQGRAAKYSAHYAHSRGSLLKRINEAIGSLGWNAETRLVQFHDGVQRRYRRDLVLTTFNNEGQKLVHVW